MGFVLFSEQTEIYFPKQFYPIGLCSEDVQCLVTYTFNF